MHIGYGFKLVLLLLWSGLATAADADAVQKLLNESTGWTVARTDSETGIQISSKPIPSLGLTAFRGVVSLDGVDPVRMCDVLMDVGSHVDVSGSLERSRVLESRPDFVEFYQVTKEMKVMLSRRAWFNHSQIERSIGGKSGRCKRDWRAVDPARYPAESGALLHKYPSIVLISVSYGSWEVRDSANGGAELVYRSVADPGGNVPVSLHARAASRTLPDNMMRFVRAAQ